MRVELALRSISSVICPVARFSKVPEIFQARKATFSPYVSKNSEVCTPCMKETSVHVEPECTDNGFAIQRLEILVRLSGCENISGPSRNGRLISILLLLHIL